MTDLSPVSGHLFRSSMTSPYTECTSTLFLQKCSALSYYTTGMYVGAWTFSLAAKLLLPDSLFFVGGFCTWNARFFFTVHGELSVNKILLLHESGLHPLFFFAGPAGESGRDLATVGSTKVVCTKQVNIVHLQVRK